MFRDLKRSEIIFFSILDFLINLIEKIIKNWTLGSFFPLIVREGLGSIISEMETLPI